MFDRYSIGRAAIFSLLAAATSIAAAAAGAPQWNQESLSTAARLRDDALAGTRALEHVSDLVTQVGPRFAGTLADRTAVAWALAYLRELGLSNVRAQEAVVPGWERGSIEIAITSPWPQRLVGVALGGSVGTSEAGIRAPVLSVASLDELAALDRGRVAGNIVFIDEKMVPSRDGSSYAVAVKKRVAGASAAARLGAAALIIRSVGTSNDRIAHTGAMRYADDAPRIPAAAISNPDADLLTREIASGEPVSIKFSSSARELPPVVSANVIAEVPGGKLRDQIVLLAAHLDSWDLGHGAEDDGAGIAIVVEAARLIAALPEPPARTIRVVLFANEEFGLSGAQAYARESHASGEQIVAALEADLGSGAPWGFRADVAASSRAALSTLRDVLAPLDLEYSDAPAHGGSDLQPLKALGTPVLEIQHDATRYFDVHHTANDTLDRVDSAGLDRHVAAYAALAYLAATMRGDFGRLPVSESTATH